MEVDTGNYPSLAQETGTKRPAKSSAAASRRGKRGAAAGAEKTATTAAPVTPPASEAAPEPAPAPAAATAATPDPLAESAPQSAPEPEAKAAAAPPPPPPPAPPVAAQSRRGDGGERQSGLIAAAVACLVAVVALAVAWSGRSDDTRLQAQLEAADARIAAQVAELRRAGDDNLDAVAMLLESEQEDRRALAGSLALLRLDARAREGGPFLQELRLAVDLMADDPAAREHLSALARSAEQGLPPHDLLRAGFDEAVLAPVRPSSAAAFFTSISGSISGSVNRLVASVMPNGHAPAAPDTRLADFARAEVALLAGDLEAAVAAVRPHGETLPQVAQHWLAVAEQRLEGERALAALDELVESALGRFR